MTHLCRWLGLSAVCAGLTLFVPLTPADDVNPKPPSKEETAKQAAQAGDVELLASAYRLAEIGEKYKSPEAMVGAGSLILKLKALTKGELGELALKPEVQDENGKPVEGAEVEVAKPESLEDIAQGFFDTATDLGIKLKMSDEVKASIKAAKARKYEESARGAKGGPKMFGRTLFPHQTHVYHVPFERYSMASVGLNASAPVKARMGVGGHIHFDQVTSVGQYSWIPSGGNTMANISIHNPHKFKVTFRLFTN